MDLYGTRGALRIPDRSSLFLRQGNAPETTAPVPRALSKPESDMLTYFVAIARGEVKSSGLSSPEINVIVAEILDAARESGPHGQGASTSPRRRETEQ
ncbi:MAG: hypothetical protein WDM96_06185 [Lacunisphaera sp.]